MAKILVVDDSKLYARMVSKELSQYHEVVATANSGKQALEVLETVKVDLILLDVTMPEMSGKECLEAILQFDESIQVIMLTAVQSSEMRDKCLDIGAKKYLNKQNINGGQGMKTLLEAIDEVHPPDRKTGLA